MTKEFGRIVKLVASACGGAVAGTLLVGNLVAYVGRHQLGPDSRVGTAYALYMGVPLGVYFALRIAPAIDSWWQKTRTTNRKPPAA